MCRMDFILKNFYKICLHLNKYCYYINIQNKILIKINEVLK